MTSLDELVRIAQEAWQSADEAGVEDHDALWRVAIAAALKASVPPVAATGFGRYDDGWNDAREEMLKQLEEE